MKRKTSSLTSRQIDELCRQARATRSRLPSFLRESLAFVSPADRSCVLSNDVRKRPAKIIKRGVWGNPGKMRSDLWKVKMSVIVCTFTDFMSGKYATATAAAVAIGYRRADNLTKKWDALGLDWRSRKL